MPRKKKTICVYIRRRRFLCFVVLLETADSDRFVFGEASDTATGEWLSEWVTNVHRLFHGGVGREKGCWTRFGCSERNRRSVFVQRNSSGKQFHAFHSTLPHKVIRLIVFTVHAVMVPEGLHQVRAISSILQTTCFSSPTRKTSKNWRRSDVKCHFWHHHCVIVFLSRLATWQQPVFRKFSEKQHVFYYVSICCAGGSCATEMGPMRRVSTRRTFWIHFLSENWKKIAKLMRQESEQPEPLK